MQNASLHLSLGCFLYSCFQYSSFQCERCSANIASLSYLVGTGATSTNQERLWKLYT